MLSVLISFRRFEIIWYQRHPSKGAARPAKIVLCALTYVSGKAEQKRYANLSVVLSDRVLDGQDGFNAEEPVLSEFLKKDLKLETGRLQATVNPPEQNLGAPTPLAGVRPLRPPQTIPAQVISKADARKFERIVPTALNQLQVATRTRAAHHRRKPTPKLL